jgi:cytochrome c oxidase subunit 2
MNEEFRLFPTEASSHAGQVDLLYFFLLSVAACFTLLIFGAIVYFILRYRKGVKADRSGSRNMNIPLEIAWISIPTALTMVMFAWGAQLYFDVAQPPGDAATVHVVAKQWMWKMQQPSGKSEINELHLPVGMPVRLQMISEDVIHSFYVPACRVKMDVLPGRYTHLWFTPNKTGHYHLFCAEYCGTSHSKMIGTIVVQEPAEYADWLRGATGESAEVMGARLFEQFRCNQCHVGGKEARCPSLVGIYEKNVPLQGGQTVLADDAYLRESILAPAAKVVAGYQPLMPTYQGQLGEEDILNLIAYIKSQSPANARTAEQTAP